MKSFTFFFFQPLPLGTVFPVFPSSKKGTPKRKRKPKRNKKKKRERERVSEDEEVSFLYGHLQYFFFFFEKMTHVSPEVSGGETATNPVSFSPQHFGLGGGHSSNIKMARNAVKSHSEN